MLVTALEVIPYSLAFAAPYVSATGTLGRREMALVRISTDAGLDGLGEAVPLSLRGGTPLEAVVAELEAVGGTLVGTDLAEGVDAGLPPLAAGLSRPAAAALEVARLDLAARLVGVPLWRLLDGVRAEPVRCNATLAAGAPAAVAAAATAWAERGFETFKLKVGTDDDVAQVAAVRDALGAGPRIRVDANGVWSAPTAAARLAALERYDVELAEQPAATLEDLAEVRQNTAIPIAADESVASPEDARRALDLGACSLATIKLSKVGGIGPARRLAAMIGYYLSSALDGPVGIAAAGHLAQVLSPAPGGNLLAHGLATQLLFSESIGTVECEIRDGFLHLPEGPGLGVELDEGALARARL